MSEDQFEEFKDYLDFKLSPLYTKIGNIDDGNGKLQSRFGKLESRFGNMEYKIASLESHMDSGFKTIAEAIDRFNDHIDSEAKSRKAINKRLRKLENTVF